MLSDDKVAVDNTGEESVVEGDNDELNVDACDCDCEVDTLTVSVVTVEDDT